MKRPYVKRPYRYYRKGDNRELKFLRHKEAERPERHINKGYTIIQKHRVAMGDPRAQEAVMHVVPVGFKRVPGVSHPPGKGKDNACQGYK